MEVFLPSSSCLVDKAAFFRFSAAAVNVLGVSISHFSRCYSVPVLSWVLYKIQRRTAHVGKLFRFFYLRDAKAFSMMALDGGANWYWNAFLISFEVCSAHCKLDWRWEIKGWKNFHCFSIDVISALFETIEHFPFDRYSSSSFFSCSALLFERRKFFPPPQRVSGIFIRITPFTSATRRRETLIKIFPDGVCMWSGDKNWSSLKCFVFWRRKNEREKKQWQKRKKFRNWSRMT